MTPYTYNAVITHIHDGGTVTCDIDLGLALTRSAMRCRLARINAPELPTPAGKASLAALEGLVGPLPAACQVQSVSWDKYDRLDVELQVLGVNVNDWMVAGGWAVPYKAEVVP